MSHCRFHNDRNGCIVVLQVTSQFIYEVLDVIDVGTLDVTPVNRSILF